jgi:hypothetical protein
MCRYTKGGGFRDYRGPEQDDATEEDYTAFWDGTDGGLVQVDARSPRSRLEYD